ncbi:MAG TPA: hypothetical protein VMN60_07115 [Longimicrobiales bacterium]|nr:hypothetical protein [Longimicrobiales bacterium]
MKTLLRTLIAMLLPLAVAGDLTAQHIALKTVPIPAGEQFLILPTSTLGMAGVYIAHDDELGDPFSNPARGALLAAGLRLLALPTIYGEASGSVGGRSLPVAVMVPGQRVFGTLAFALQQVDNPDRFTWFAAEQSGSVIQDNSSSNVYVQGTLGLKLSERTAVGASLYHADLDAVDAVNLLYGRSVAINQSGGMTEVRLGAVHDFGGERRLDAIVLRNNVDMKHDVMYQEWTWRQQDPPLVRTWNELNEDRTETWGAHLRWVQPIGEHGARLGAVATVNTKSHPKIPNYNIVNIPRDPGNSTAFIFGAGLTTREGPSTFSMELQYEPGRSHTWAYADTIIPTPAGTLQPGDKTIDNQFRFGSWNLAFGIDREGEKTGLQLGLRLREFRYSLDQHNYLTALRRETNESWLEWSPSWSGVVKFPEFELRYSGRFTAKGWPNSRGCFFVCEDRAVAPAGPDFVIGPTAPVTLPEFRVTTHRLTISVPFRL